MESFKSKIREDNKGFSLLEVLVALFIFGTIGVLLFQNLSTTSFAIYNLEKQYLAREIAANRLVFIKKLQRPYRNQKRNIPYEIGGREWVLNEEIIYKNPKYFNYRFIIREKGHNQVVYETSNIY